MQPKHTTGPNLTNVNRIGRIGVKASIALLVFLIVGKMGYEAFVAYWKATHPPPPPAPSAGFGVLPQIAFPLQDDSDKPTAYTLETSSSRLPVFPDRAKVFFMVKAAPSLLADSEAKDLAAKFGFTDQPDVLDEKTYRWTNTQSELISTFEMDITQKHFTLSSDFLSRPNLILEQELPTDFDAVSSVRAYLRSANMLPKDATAPGVVKYTKVVGGDLVEAVSLSDADYLAIHLNRAPIDDQIPMVTEYGKTGTITALVSNNRRFNQGIMQLNFNHYTVDYTLVHTYPIKTADAAWKILQAGEGYIASGNENASAVIRSVSLGYFDSTDEYQSYLQPVYVFEGDNDFIGYVPAVASEYIQ